MPKIVIDARNINSSTGHYIWRLLENLELVDQKNQYVVLVKSRDLDFYKPKNPNFSLMAADFANYSLAEQTKFNRFLRSLDADLVHFTMPQQPIRYRRPKITTVHDLTLLNTYNSDKNWLVFRFKQLVGRVVFRRVGRDSRLILTPSQFTKKAFINFAQIPAKKVRVTYEAASENDKISLPYKAPFKKFLLYVGQQTDYKNLKRLADAHQKLLAKHPDLGLILVGKINRSPRGVAAYIESKKYHQIHLTGYIDDQQRNWLYIHCSAYIFPSLMEGFGLPGLEAMANDAPLISSNATCLPEIYGPAAIYFDPTDTDQMVQAIETVLGSGRRRAELIRLGKKQVKKYSWRRCAEQTLAANQEKLGSNN
jgi:glycosyltransferase involved in cell wall biosynthesis